LPKETAVLLGGAQEKVKFSKHFAQRNIPDIFTFLHLEFVQHFFQVASLSCLSVPPLPVILKQAAAATLAGTIYVCGGYSSISLQTQSACWSWQPGEKGWQAAQPLVKSRRCFTITTLGNMMGMFISLLRSNIC
jgi:hypothetical protein